MIKVDETFIETTLLFKKQYNLKKLLSNLGNPQNNIKVINVVGTNGKGSTSKYIYDGLRSKFKNIGLFISPAFLYQNERIQLNGNYINDEDLKKLYNDNKKIIKEYELTFFEIWMFLAVLYFNKFDIDYAVIEAGIGGRLDCTNLFENQVCVCLTSIGYDHTELLGNNIESIIEHKVGIIKPGRTLFVSSDNKKYKKIIKEKVNEKVVFAKKVKNKINYQRSNIGLAKKVLKWLDVKYNNYIAPIGRYTYLNETPKFIIDGCHNIDGVKTVIKQIKKLNNPIVIYASSKEKDYFQILKVLKKNIKNLYITDFEHPKSWIIPKDLKSDYNYIGDWKIFLEKNIYNNIVVCGSLYFIPQVYEWYRSK
ncbi:folylpolyglutamate synthase [Spiroplasma litorale]|uniref:Folylpolyglutamate synthase n=1 Tax=Spiroplasma litorale TaxID=216942 RepID=A0A0K1W089_9MOLU|nr:Mur ligase family protein [Spiroplasma litorale]AKX33725.1 folylpolyglutamate synthase [Spiroplasma litorale]